MITRLQLLRNVGRFDNAAPVLDLRRLTLIYAENARGKTTLAAIMRSLATGDAVPIMERRRLGAAGAPHVVIACDGAPQPAVFQNGAWSRQCPEVRIFDDVFVDQNVYSGLDVGPGHRQNLHELILGATGVALARRVDELATEIRAHNANIRERANAIPAADRHGLSVDEFCALPVDAAVDQTIAVAEQRLAALQQAGRIQATQEFASLSLPVINVARVTALLQQTVEDLDAAAEAAVRLHFQVLGDGSELWVANGMRYAAGHPDDAGRACPFCRQNLRGSDIFDHYRAHFAQAYQDLQTNISNTLDRLERALGGDALAGFERQVRAAENLHRFWSAFCELPNLGMDTTQIARDWQAARDALQAVMRTKRADPLTQLTFDAAGQTAVATYERTAQGVNETSNSLLRANENVRRVKEAARAGNLQVAQRTLDRALAVRARHTPAIVPLCDEYLRAKEAKERAEADKNRAQAALETHRVAVFPAYQAAINRYLGCFNAGFTIEQVQPQNTPGRPSCTYRVVFDGHPINVAAGNGPAGTPSFKNTLSGGDRNTLALAFFFASLERDPNCGSRIVVLDDPVSSLDEHRCIATIQETRGLVPRVAQVIVLSHSKSFLARIWQHADQPNVACITVTRTGAGSSLNLWDVTDETVTEYDRRHARLRDYVATNAGNFREVAQSIRPVLEGYLRVACPEHFPPGRLLGPFRTLAQQRAAAGAAIIEAAQLIELENLIEYSNRFHHDTNAAWDTEQINDGELLGFVQRTLNFVAA